MNRASLRPEEHELYQHTCMRGQRRKGEKRAEKIFEEWREPPILKKLKLFWIWGSGWGSPEGAGGESSCKPQPGAASQGGEVIPTTCWGTARTYIVHWPSQVCEPFYSQSQEAEKTQRGKATAQLTKPELKPSSSSSLLSCSTLMTQGWGKDWCDSGRVQHWVEV